MVLFNNLKNRRMGYCTMLISTPNPVLQAKVKFPSCRRNVKNTILITGDIGNWAVELDTLQIYTFNGLFSPPSATLYRIERVQYN